MAWIRLAILTVFVMAVAGCGGGSTPLESETAARQAATVGEADAALTGPAASTALQG